MADLIMRVRAEYESAVACREELKKVEEELKNVNDNTSPKKIEQLTQRYVQLTKQLEGGLSTIGKLGYYTHDTFKKIGEIIKGSNKDIKNGVDANENLYSTLTRRLQVEERITEECGKQKEETEKQLKVAKEGLERNSSTLDKLREQLSAKYDGKGEGFWSEKDQAKMARGREAVGNWEAEVKDKELQLSVIDDILSKSEKRIDEYKEKLSSFDLPPLDLKSNIDDMTAQIAEGEKKVGELKNNLSSLYDELNERTDFQGAKNKMYDLYAEIGDKKNEIDELQQKIDGFSISSLVSQQQSLSAYAEEVSDKLRTEEETISGLKAQQEGLNEQSAMYQTIQDKIDLHTAERERLVQILDLTNKSIEETNANIEKETKTHSENQQKVKELTDDVSGLTAEYEKQKEIVNDTDANKEAIRNIKSEIKDTKDEISQTTDTTERLKDVLEKVDEAYKKNQDNAQNVYKGFVRTGTEATPATRVFTNETDYNRSIELHDHAANLESQITNGVESGSLSIEKLQSLQEELKAVQAELIPLDEKARDTALLLGDNLGQKAAALTQKLFESNKAVEDAERSYNNLNKELERAKDFLKTMEENSSDQKGISEAKQKVDELTASLNEQSEALAKAKAEQKDAQEDINKTSGELGDALDELKSGEGILADFDKAVSMLPAPLRNVASGVKGVGNAMKILAKNPLMIALGALVLVLQSVWQWFNKSAEGQRAFAKISGYVGGIITRLEEVVVKFGGAVFNVIKNIVKALASPKKAIKSVIDFLADQVKNRLKGIVDAFVGAGQTIANVFVDLWESIKKGKLDFSNTQKSLKKVLDGVLAIGTGFNNVTDKIYNAAEATVDWVKETHNVAMESKAIAEEERELGLEIEKNREKTLKLQKSMAELQATMRNTNLSKAERKKALEEYKKQVAEQAKIQRDFAEKRRSLHQRKLDLDEPDTIEEMQQQAALANAVLSADVAMQRQLTALTRVSNSINKGETGKSKARLNEEYQLLLNENAQKQAKQIRENGYIIEQARINAMEEGTARTIAQMKLDFKKEQDAAVEYEDELKRQKLKRARDEFYKNPNNKKKTFDLSSVDTSMTEQERKVEASKISDAENKYADSLKKLLTPYETVQEKQQKKAADFMALKNHLADEEIRKTMEIAELTGQLADADDIQKTNIQKQIDEREKEISILEKRRDVINATMRTQDEELNKLREFLKEYGSFDQKRQAIKDDYADKIAKARAEGDYIGAATLEQKQEKDLSATRIEEVKATMDWEGLFNNLESYSSDYLNSVRKDLAALLTDPDIQPDDAQVVAEKIAQIDSVMNEKLGSTFRWVNDYLTTQKRLQMEAATAAKEYEKALKEQIDAQVNLDSARGNVLGQLSYEEQQKLEEKGITPDNLYKNAKDIFTILGIDEDSEKAKKLKESLKALAEQEVKTAAATGKATKAQAKKNNAEEKAEGMKAAEKVAAWLNGVNENIQKYLGDIPNLLDSIGLGSVGEKVGKGLSGVNDAVGAASDFASGNYVGAAFKGISAIKNFGSMLGIGGGNEKEVAETTERLTKQNESLQHAIEALTEVMDNSYGGKALTTYKKALEAQETINKNQMEILEAQMGYHSAHHSNAYYADDNEIRKYNKQAQEAMRTAGVEISTITGLKSIYNLTPEQLKAIRDFAPDLWRYLTEVGKYDKSEYWDAVVEQAGKTEELTEQIMTIMTTQTEESVFSQFLSQLKELANGSKTVFTDIANDWQDMVNEMVVNNFIGDEYQEKLKEWRKKIYELNKKYKEGSVTLSQFKNGLSQLENEYTTYVKEARSEIDDYRAVGIIANPDKKAEQSATANSISNISYDQADSLVGIGMAQQMAIEQSRDRLDILNTRFDDVMGGMVEQRNISADSREILAGMAIHVEEIRDGVVDTIVPRIKTMSDDLSKVRKYVEEQ